MSSPAKAVLVGGIAVGSFLAGIWYNHNPRGQLPAGARRVLYYQDPMHPAYKSDKPGIAPDCGMKLEPVYEGGAPGARQDDAPAAQSLALTPAGRHVLGIRTARVETVSAPGNFRVPGRVATDETRVYKINSTVEGWVRDIKPVVAGSVVHKDEVLATYYAVEFLSAQRGYIFALVSRDRFQSAGNETEAQMEQNRAAIQQARLVLRNLGMSESQMDQIARTRQTTEDIRIVAPAAGFVTSRSIFPGQKFDRGTEFFRIADLDRIWVFADLLESDARLVQSLRAATVRYQGRSFQARISGSLAQFDPASRALRVRLELDNPGYALRPDMFVDVDFKVALPSGVVAPADAIIDSGVRKTVYVESEEGMFEPRTVDTGWRMGERVQITRGLEPGELIAVSGNFLLDSESRMKMATLAAAGVSGKDPVCGMEVDPAKAVGKSTYKEKTYYFCSQSCQAKFEKEPGKYVKDSAPVRLSARPPSPGQVW